jgi:hypothetical protein
MKDKMRNKDIDKNTIFLRRIGSGAARSEIRERNQSFVRKQIGFKYAFVAISSVVLLFAILVPILFLHNQTVDNQAEYVELGYSSMYDYFKVNNLNINTYDHLLDKNMDTEGGNLPHIESPYLAEECILVQSQGTDIYIKQKYNYFDIDMITVSVLLVDDDGVKQTIFGDFFNLKKILTLCKWKYIILLMPSPIWEMRNLFIMRKNFLLKLACDNESRMLTHIQALLISQ